MIIPGSARKGIAALAALTFLGTAAAQTGPGFAVSTQPSPVQAGRPFQVTVAGIFRPNLAGDPRGADVTVYDGSITVALRRDCGFLCPTSAFQAVTFSVPPLGPGSYVMKIYQGGVLPIGAPDVQFTFTASPLNYQGLWWKSPAGSESGWGLSIDHQGEILFGVWYTYDASGNGMWLVMPRTEKTGQGVYSGPIYRTSGPPFDSAQWNSSSVNSDLVGMATLSFSDSSSGTFTYSMNGKTESKSITRNVFSSPVASCVATN